MSSFFLPCFLNFSANNLKHNADYIYFLIIFVLPKVVFMSADNLILLGSFDYNGIWKLYVSKFSNDVVYLVPSDLEVFCSNSLDQFVCSNQLWQVLSYRIFGFDDPFFGHVQQSSKNCK